MNETQHDRSERPTPRSSTRWIVLAAALAAVGVLGAGAAYSLKGTGAVTAFLQKVGLRKPSPPQGRPIPIVIGTLPPDRATGVDPTAPIRISLRLPNGPIDPATVNDDAVGLFRVRDRSRVEATVKFEGDDLVVTPRTPLEDHRNYRLHLRPVLRDGEGNVVKEITRAFSTTSQPPPGVAFTKVEMAASQMPDEQRAMYTDIAIAPDRRLYAATMDGRLMRFRIAEDGTLTDREVFNSIQVAERGPRTFTGFVIDPQSDPAEPVIYVTHSGFNIEHTTGYLPNFDNVPDFTGKVSRLSGPKFEKVEDIVVNLPRSARDHAPNQLHFGPDGALYFPQPSNTAMGAPDDYWRMRQEWELCATILRLDIRAIPAGAPPLDVKTRDAGGTYDPSAPGALLTIYTTGLRMPYDLLWHSNGKMYSAINGSSSGGATPAGPGVPAIPRVGIAEHDWFFKIEPGGYHGHPNPETGTYVLNDGNPTDKPDFNEVSEYPVGVKPDPNWSSAIYDFGTHVSANGTIEYRSDRFGGALKGKIFVCRFNLAGDDLSDLLCLGLDENGDVNYIASGIPGTSGFLQALDLTEDPTNGNLYVCEFGKGQIVLLRATERPEPVAP